MALAISAQLSSAVIMTSSLYRSDTSAFRRDSCVDGSTAARSAPSALVSCRMAFSMLSPPNAPGWWPASATARGAQHDVAVGVQERAHALGRSCEFGGGGQGVQAGTDARAVVRLEIGDGRAQPFQLVVGRLLALALAQRVLQGQVLLGHVTVRLRDELPGAIVAGQQMLGQFHQLGMRVGFVRLLHRVHDFVRVDDATRRSGANLRSVWCFSSTL